jgi:hypothetical protein
LNFFTAVTIGGYPALQFLVWDPRAIGGYPALQFLVWVPGASARGWLRAAEPKMRNHSPHISWIARVREFPNSYAGAKEKTKCEFSENKLEKLRRRRLVKVSLQTLMDKKINFLVATK